MQPTAAEELLQLAYVSDLVRETCNALQLSQRVTASAQLLLHRYYAHVSIVDRTTVWTAGAVVLISSKLADESRSLRHVANVLHDRIVDREGIAESIMLDGKEFRQPLEFYGAEGYDWKVSLLETERAVMTQLGFRLMVELPHKFVLVFLNTLRERAGGPNWTENGVGVYKNILQSAWNFASDLLLSALCVQEEPEDLAVACIAKALVKCDVELPQAWQKVFGCSVENCDRIAVEIEKVYKLTPLRGRFVDYSNCHVFERFSPRRTVEEYVDAGPEKSKWRQRKRRRFEDAIVSRDRED